MRASLVETLRCPRCRRDRALRATTSASTDRELRDGHLDCTECGERFAIKDGIVDLLHRPPGYVQREAAGLERFAAVMEADGWTKERILNLPDEPSPYWHGQRASFDALLARESFEPGQRLLDLGSNTCWASAAFARRGLDVVALDITTQLRQGLATAEWWMERDGTHFERVRGTMARLPFANATFDHVFCCEVLHHNHPRQLFQTMSEAARVLRPGGVLSVIREGLRAPGNPMLDPGRQVAEFEGNEHAYLAATYFLAAGRAGLLVRPEDPADHWALSNKPFPEDPDRGPAARAKLACIAEMRTRPRGRKLYRAWLHHVAGTVPLHFTATKSER